MLRSRSIQILVLLLATILSVSALAIPRNLDTVDELSERDSGDYTADLYVRTPVNNVAQHGHHEQMHSMMAAQQVKKQYKADKKAGLAPAKPAKYTGPKLNAQAKTEVKAHFDHANTLHRATTNLPGRKDTFQPQHGAAPHTGHDVRKAAFQSHLATGDHKPKAFNNRPFPAGHATHAGQHPVPHLAGVTPKAKEHPVTHGGPGYLADPHKNKGGSRILMSPNAPGTPHRFEAVIAHNPHVPAGQPGHNDHYQAAHHPHV